jgi:SAM-dependent methyltransferase
LARLVGWRRVLYDALYVSPSRFVDDRQRRRGKNAHKRILEFVALAEGLVIDVGSGDRRLAQNVVTTDLVLTPNVDIRLDAACLPFADDSLERLVIQEVLEHVPNSTLALREIARVLRPGGLAYVEVPFLFPIHDRADYRRWTIAGLETDARPLEVIESGTAVGPFSALVVMMRGVLTHRIGNPYLAFLGDTMLGWTLRPLLEFDRLLGVRKESQEFAGAVYAILRKP